MTAKVLMPSGLALFTGVAFAMVGVWSVRKGKAPWQMGFIAKAEYPFLYWAQVIIWLGLGAALVVLGICMLFIRN